MRRLLLLLICMLILTALVPWAYAAEKVEPRKKAAKKEAAGKKSAKQKKNLGGKNEALAKEKKTPVTGKKTLHPPVAEAVAVPSPSLAFVKEMRHWSNPDYTRIAVNLDREVSFESHQLPQNREAGIPPRLYIDIKGARMAQGIKDIPIGDGLLKTARIAQFRSDIVRVVLDMDSIKDYKIFTFSDPFRIIIDAKGDRREELTRPRENTLAPLTVVPAVKAEPEGDKAKGPPKVTVGNIRRIVVDPGHGGHDPGAVGALGTHEKDIVLQIGLTLARKLREELGLDVVVTRTTDVFLELQERTAIANQVGADLFVSIHANAALNRATSGIETYYLNLAKTEKAAQLAAKENGTSLEKVSLLQAVLFDLMANYKINDSAHLAEEVQKALHRKVSTQYSVKNLGVKQGPFYVLVGATMPSILIETAFLSNEREEQRLLDPQYQEATAEGILDGIKGYIASLKQ